MKVVLMLCVMFSLTIAAGCGPSKGVNEAPPPVTEPENLEPNTKPGV